MFQNEIHEGKTHIRQIAVSDKRTRVRKFLKGKKKSYQSDLVEGTYVLSSHRVDKRTTYHCRRFLSGELVEVTTRVSDSIWSFYCEQFPKLMKWLKVHDIDKECPGDKG